MKSERSKERKQFLFNIFVTAIEGGIGYSAHSRTYHWKKEDGTEDIDGFFSDVIDAEGEGAFKKKQININTIARGLNRIIKGDDVKINKTLLGYILLGNRTNDAGDIDSDCADVIVQAGLFNEIVFG